MSREDFAYKRIAKQVHQFTSKFREYFPQHFQNDTFGPEGWLNMAKNKQHGKIEPLVREAVRFRELCNVAATGNQRINEMLEGFKDKASRAADRGFEAGRPGPHEPVLGISRGSGSGGAWGGRRSGGVGHSGTAGCAVVGVVALGGARRPRRLASAGWFARLAPRITMSIRSGSRPRFRFQVQDTRNCFRERAREF